MVVRNFKEKSQVIDFQLLGISLGAQNRSNQMKGYALLWKQVRVLEKLTIY